MPVGGLFGKVDKMDSSLWKYHFPPFILLHPNIGKGVITFKHNK